MNATVLTNSGIGPSGIGQYPLILSADVSLADAILCGGLLVRPGHINVDTIDNLAGLAARSPDAL